MLSSEMNPPAFPGLTPILMVAVHVDSLVPIDLISRISSDSAAYGNMECDNMLIIGNWRNTECSETDGNTTKIPKYKEKTDENQCKSWTEGVGEN